jgi:hypothetical protein
MGYISGLALAMVGNSRGSRHLVDCSPSVERLTDCVGSMSSLVGRWIGSCGKSSR